MQPYAKSAAKQLKEAIGAHTIVAPLPAEIAPFAQQAGNPFTVVVVGTAFGGEIVDPQAHDCRRRRASDTGGAHDRALRRRRSRRAREGSVPRCSSRTWSRALASRPHSSRARLQAGRPGKHELVPHVRHRRGQHLLAGNRDRLDDAPILRQPTDQVTFGRSQVRPLHDRRQHPHGRAPPRRGELLGREHLARRALERDDARDRQGLSSAAGSRLRAHGEDRHVRRRLRRPGHGGVLRRARPRGRDPRRHPGAHRAARRPARCRSTSRVSRRCSSGTATACTSRSTSQEAVDGADFLYVAVGTPPTESGDADLAAVWSVIDELPADLPAGRSSS